MSKEHLNYVRRRLRDKSVQGKRREIRQSLIETQNNCLGEESMEIEEESSLSSKHQFEDIKHVKQFILHYQLNHKHSNHCEHHQEVLSSLALEHMISHLHKAAIHRQKLTPPLPDLRNIQILLLNALQTKQKSNLKGQCMTILLQYFYSSFSSYLKPLLSSYNSEGKQEIAQLRQIKKMYCNMNTVLDIISEKICRNEASMVEITFFMQIVAQKIEMLDGYQLLENEEVQKNIEKICIVALVIIEKIDFSHELLNYSLFICQFITKNHIELNWKGQGFQIWTYLNKAFTLWYHHQTKHQIRMDNLALIFRSTYNILGRLCEELQESQYFFVHRLISHGITLHCKQELQDYKMIINKLTMRLMLECLYFHKFDLRWLDFCLSLVEQGYMEEKMDNNVKLALIVLCHNDKYGLSKMIELKNFLGLQKESYIFSEVISDFQKMEAEAVIAKLLDSVQP